MVLTILLFLERKKNLKRTDVHCIGFAIKLKIAIQMPECLVGINKHLMTLHVQLKNRQHTTLINVYTLTLDADEKTKVALYSELNQVLLCVPKEDKINFHGNFHARAGKGL